MTEQDVKIYKFEQFRLDVEDKTLWRGIEKVSIPLKAFEVLTLLVEKRGRTVTKDEILEKIWADTFVDENNLAVMISALRKALGEKKGENHFIETVPRRGYRFVADLDETIGDLIVERHLVTEITVAPPENKDLPDVQKQFNRQSFAVMIFAALAIILVSFLAYSFWNSSKEKTNQPAVAGTKNQPQAIAVLPLRNLSPKADEQERLSLGLTDALITRLAGLRELSVRPTSAVLPFAENPPSAQTVLEKLKVENYLEGTIQREANRLRVSVQLIKTSDGSIIWAGKFDEADNDLLKLQDAIAGEIVSVMRFKLSPQERETLARRGTENDEAFRLYLQGRYFWNKRNVESLKKSISFYEQALGKDPKYSLADVGLADSYQLLAEYNGMPAAEAFGKARIYAKKALEIDENLGEAHCSLAYTQAFFDWDWPAAERSFKRAIDLSPNYPTVHQWYGEYLIAVGKFEAGFAETQKAHELDPVSLIILADYAGYYYLTRQFDKAIEQSRQINEMDENFIYGYVYSWISFEQKEMLEDAKKELFKVDSLGLPPALVQQNQAAYEKEGWKGLWLSKYRQTTEPPLNQYFNDYQRALSALRIDDTEATFYWLQKSYEARNRWFVNLKYDPEWDKIRRDPRFTALIRQANLEP